MNWLKKPLLIFGGLVIVVAVASWFAFPAWRSAPGGFLGLLGVVILGLLAVIKDGVGIMKDLKELAGKEKGDDPAKPAEASRKVTAKGERSVAAGGDISGTVITGDGVKGQGKNRKKKRKG